MSDIRDFREVTPCLPYRLRVSPRARDVSLRVTVERGLEVVVPRGYDAALVPRVLEHMQGWIRRALDRAEANRRHLAPEPPWRLPTEIALPGIGKQWQVIAKESARASVSIREIEDARLSITGTLGNERACRRALERWLVRQANRELIPPLAALSRELGLRYREAHIRLQRTRWGSCSGRKSISLNAKLLLLPPALVRSVLIHELCHLAEMNHSARFWSLVKRHDPDFRAHRKSLRAAWKLVPPWSRPSISP
ncbi:MAG TPA: SprT family zinc-dependent metalloprotease [Burkholderiales bacterium]